MWRGGALFGDRGAGETHLELLGVNGAGAVSVDVGDHLLDLLLLRLETQGTHGHLQLLGVDGAGAVSVEQIEGLTDLLLLLLGERELVALGGLLPAGSGAAVVGLQAQEKVHVSGLQKQASVTSPSSLHPLMISHSPRIHPGHIRCAHGR